MHVLNECCLKGNHISIPPPPPLPQIGDHHGDYPGGYHGDFYGDEALGKKGAGPRNRFNHPEEESVEEAVL